LIAVYPGDIIPERWAKSSRNAERHQIGLAGDIIPDSRATSPGISTPNRRASVIALCFKLRRRVPRLAPRAKLAGTSVGIRFGIVGVAIEHQHRDAPDVDLPYHAGKSSLICFRTA